MDQRGFVHGNLVVFYGVRVVGLGFSAPFRDIALEVWEHRVARKVGFRWLCVFLCEGENWQVFSGTLWSAFPEKGLEWEST